MAGTSAIIAAVAAVGSASASAYAANEQNKAQKKAAGADRAAAQLQNQRNIRRAIAARRVQEANLIQGSATSGARTSSALEGSVGSLRTQTASNIGFANTQLASKLYQSRTLQRGANRAVFGQTVAGAFDSIGQASYYTGQAYEKFKIQ